MDKENLVDIIKASDSERKAEYLEKLMIIQVQTAINLSNDRRVISLYPSLLNAKKQRVDAMQLILTQRVEKLDALISQIGAAFGVLHNTTRAAIISPIVIAFWAVALADLIGKQLIYTNAIFELEGLVLDEIARPLEDYYIMLPIVDP